MCTFLIQRYIWKSNRLSEDNRGIWMKGFQGWKVFYFKILVSSNINECLDQSHCDNSSETCINTVGSYHCDCRTGYQNHSTEDGRKYVCQGGWNEFSNHKFAANSNTARLEQRANTVHHFSGNSKQINTTWGISLARITMQTLQDFITPTLKIYTGFQPIQELISNSFLLFKKH